MLLFIALLLVLATFPVHAQEKDFAVFLNQSSTAFSDSVPIKDFEEDLKGGSEPVPGNHAVTYNKVELGFAWRNIELAHFIREDYVFDFSPDTMNIIYWDKNKIPIPAGKVYDVYLKAQHIRAEGWRLGYAFFLSSDSQIKLSLNYLEAEDLLYGALKGKVTVENGDINGGNLGVNYYYVEDYLLDRPPVTPASGTGYSIDVQADLNFPHGWRLELDVFDLLGQIYWRDAPYTEATIASTRTYYDSNGYAHRDPMLRAKEGYRNFTQNLPVFYQISLNKRIYGPFGLGYTREKYDQVDFDRLLLQWYLTRHIHLAAGYDFTLDATWFGLNGKAFSLVVATDDWSLVSANSLTLRLNGRWSF